MSGRDGRPEMGEEREAALAAVPEGTRGGEDARRRGWFWHWNSLVTQYAPLIGLKGVGLLNSYTVWTDRREESPHRGYAFPSQQREADFYGEDRAELITINKILVALDLIEIRKEMVLRADAQGRRWKVPHNFYRVKDHDDSFSLSTGDVLKVADLAERDRAVYRYLRRVFSPKFAPIDEGNVWARILPEVRQTAVWQRLAARAEAEERRASDRTRAGHAARKGAAPVEAGDPVLLVPGPGDTPAGSRVDSDSAAVDTLVGEETSVAPVNNGSGPAVAPANDGLTLIGVTGVGPANAAVPTSVDPANTTYHQDVQTTTTTGEGRFSTIPDLSAVAGPIRRQGGPSDSAPDDAPGRAAAIRAFEAANDRTATPAERTILAQLAERFLPAAAAGGASGWAWTEAAIYEAVEAGSRYVAPRRIREILLRWEREGYPQAGEDGGRGRLADNPRPASAGAGVALPGGVDAGRAWAATLDALAAAMDRDALRDLTAGTSICGCAGGVVTVAAADAAQANRLAGYAALIGRKLSGVLRRDVEVRFLAGDGPAPDDGPRRTRRQPVPASVPEREAAPAAFVVAECGMPSGPVWSAVVAEACAGGGASTAEAEVWLKPTVLLGRGGDGGEGSPLVVGATSAMARRRLETRHRAALAAAAAAVLGRPVGLEFVVAREWLAGRDDEAEGA